VLHELLRVSFFDERLFLLPPSEFSINRGRDFLSIFCLLNLSPWNHVASLDSMVILAHVKFHRGRLIFKSRARAPSKRWAYRSPPHFWMPLPFLFSDL